MIPALIIVGGIVVVFFALLLVHRWASWIRCLLCASVSLTWIALLVLYHLGVFPYPVLIAVLMGGSAVGVYVVIERHVPTRWQVFRLPMLLSLFLLVYALLNQPGLIAAAVLVSAIWAVIALIAAFHRSPRARALVERLIKCCRDW
ncbi:MAG: hypothetical protein ABIG71_00305 [Candidatus Uhrbacteria bacterium]